MTSHGRYIVLEGTDGAGKSLQAEMLIRKLVSSDIPSALIYEPGGGTLMGQKIRELLKDPQLQRESGTDVFLFVAARVEALTKVKELTRRGTWCVSDRHWLSTMAYQGYGHGFDLEMLHWLRQRMYIQMGIKPDLELVLSVPGDVAANRRNRRGTTDYFEQQGREFDNRVRQGYIREANRLHIPIVDASGTPEEVFENVWHYTKPLIKGD